MKTVSHIVMSGAFAAMLVLGAMLALVTMPDKTTQPRPLAIESAESAWRAMQIGCVPSSMLYQVLAYGENIRVFVAKCDLVGGAPKPPVRREEQEFRL